MLIPTVITRRLWAKLEVMPFRYGVALAVGAVTVIGLLVAGFLVVGNMPRDEATPRRPPLEAAVPSAPAWGGRATPRRARPARPARTQVAAPRPRTTSASPRPRSTRGSPRPSPTMSCPPSFKKWQWAWAMCKRKQNG